VEIDCWDGPRVDSPLVTHGHTFCTTEHFSEVANAISDCAFVTSDLPVILSLEMHCSPKQQNSLAHMLVAHLDDTLLAHRELADLKNASSLSPVDLKHRILVKGKIKSPQQTRPANKGRKSLQARLLGVSNCVKRKSSFDESTPDTPNPLTTSTLLATRSSQDFEQKGRSSEANQPDAVDEMAEARHMLYRCKPANRRTFSAPKRPSEDVSSRSSDNLRLSGGSSSYLSPTSASGMTTTDPYFASLLGLRSVPVREFLHASPPPWPLPITSINEDTLLAQLGLRRFERHQIEGLQMGPTRGSDSRASAAQSASSSMSRALERLAVEPPLHVGTMQKRTAARLLRPFPLGLRMSGSNMSPIPGWLAGSQSVCLNFSDNDLACQLHFALFQYSDGFLLKPREMCVRSEWTLQVDDSSTDHNGVGSEPVQSVDAFWPPPRARLHCVSMHILSLHNLPKRDEKRPRYDGSRGACHAFHPELSGRSAPPDGRSPASPALAFRLHAIGGVCAVSDALPVAHPSTHLHIASEKGSGLCANYSTKHVHCVAAEPHETFLRVSVLNQGVEMAYETAVLGMMRHGLRVFQLRGALGTRIELCCLLVRIGLSSQPNVWPSARQLRLQAGEMEAERETFLKKNETHREAQYAAIERLTKEVELLNERNVDLERQLGERKLSE